MSLTWYASASDQVQRKNNWGTNKKWRDNNERGREQRNARLEIALGDGGNRTWMDAYTSYDDGCPKNYDLVSVCREQINYTFACLSSR